MTLAYTIVLTNGWQIYTRDPAVVDDFRTGAPSLTVHTTYVNGDEGSTYHLNRDRVVCIRELRRWSGNMMA